MDINTYEVILTDTAKEELEDIYDYIANTLLEKNIADKLMKKIERSILRLEQSPYSCMKVLVKPNNGTYRKLVIDNYIVIYDIEEKYKQVVVYRVIYEGRDYLLIEDQI